MRIVDALLRGYAYLYHFLMAAFLTGIALVAYLTGTHNINTGGMNQMTGVELTNCLLGIGLTGLLGVVLGATGIFRYLFPIYATGAAFTLFRWFFASAYRFDSQEAFQAGVLLFAGAVGAMLASWTEFRRRPKTRR
jgi:hypothetical protein